MRHAAATGSAQAGEALPSVRQLAVQLRVNPNTVARAYRELEAEGVVFSGSGRIDLDRYRWKPRARSA